MQHVVTDVRCGAKNNLDFCLRVQGAARDFNRDKDLARKRLDESHDRFEVFEEETELRLLHGEH